MMWVFFWEEESGYDGLVWEMRRIGERRVFECYSCRSLRNVEEKESQLD
jgi:hypothetical protein